MFFEERMLEECRRRTPKTDADDGRTDDGACLYYKLTHEPKGSGELKSKGGILRTIFTPVKFYGDFFVAQGQVSPTWKGIVRSGPKLNL